jgi:ketopantoate reductase
VRSEPAFAGCRTEASLAARAAGAVVDVHAVRTLHDAAPPEMQSSMQKDIAHGREPELAAIAGPTIRLGNAHGFSTMSTESLLERIETRLR